MAKKTIKKTALAKRQAPKKAAAKKAPKKPESAPTNHQATDETIQLQLVPERLLGDGVNVHDFGLVSMRLSPEEEAKLNEPLDINDVRIKPDGAVYVPHYVYTRRLNAAFGRTAWQMVPAARPQIVNGIVSMPYRLHVHGKPIAFAWGEQEYHPNNKNQTYGDAIEATMASGIRRCCKHLGIGSDLWDSSFGEAFKAEYCIEVRVNAKRKDQHGNWKKEVKYQWRRLSDPPFYNEITGVIGQQRRDEDDEDDWQERRQQEAPRPQQGRPQARQQTAQRAALPPAGGHAHSDAPISDAQRQRLWAIARGRGRTDEETRAYIKAQGYERSEAIRRSDYDRICTALAAPGML